MPHQDGYIYKGSTYGVDLLSDIQTVLESNYNDIGRLVKLPTVNAFSKVHPQDINHVAPATSEERVAAKYGLSIPEYTTATSLKNSSATWSYKKGSWYRLNDFDGYYHNAPLVMTCPVNRTIVMNAVDENHDTSIPFYVFSLGGSRSTNWLYNRKLDKATGVGSASAVPDTYKNYCLSAEELTTLNGNALINNHVFFGVALFNQNNTLVDLGSVNDVPRNPIVCTHAIRNDSSTEDDDMFKLQESSITSIALGSFTAIPCLRIGNPLHEIGQVTLFAYAPLCKDPISTGTNYPCNFTLNVGGASTLYTANILGVATSASGDPSTNLTTTASTVYVFIRVTNKSGKLSYTSPGNTMGFWVESPILTANVTYGDDTSWVGSRTATTSLVSTTPGQSASIIAFEIPNNGTQTLIYRLDNIWNSDPTQPSKLVNHGTIGITQHLYFQPTGQTGEEFGGTGGGEVQ